VTSGLNRRFSYDGNSEHYFTALYGVLDLPGREFRYTSAGHPGPLVISNGTGELHRAHPPAVGFLPDGHFVEERLTFQPGDRLYLYTDGIFEITNREGTEFGEARLREVLESASTEPLARSLERARDSARAWLDDRPFEDDVSLMAVEIR